MKPLTVVFPYRPDPFWKRSLLALLRTDLVETAIVVRPREMPLEPVRGTLITEGGLTEQETLDRIFVETRTPWLLVSLRGAGIEIIPQALERALRFVESERVGLLYSDFYGVSEEGRWLYPLNDYQLGSVRDDFDFGEAVLISVSAAKNGLERHGPIPAVRFAGFYDLRLKLSIDHRLYHLPEPFYTAFKAENRFRDPCSDEERFAYVDPRHESVQKEMEAVFTDYLRRIGAYLPPETLRDPEPALEPFPVEASVVIPVRNRRETIRDSLESALSQRTGFPFNVIVVDNHSTDGTTDLVSDLARRDRRLVHIVPQRRDLGIGGCWNEALHSSSCGRFAVQLDSDDLYRTEATLQSMVDRLRESKAPMVVGSYTVVDFDLNEVPPGLIDHREWTPENGHNNLLRVNGVGAPRGFRTDVMRRIGFLNVSYGEDYAAALTVSRRFRIERIYENLYLCRRWSGNSDQGLTLEASNRNNAFKDEIRTKEIRFREERVLRIEKWEKGRKGKSP